VLIQVMIEEPEKVVEHFLELMLLMMKMLEEQHLVMLSLWNSYNLVVNLVVCCLCE